MTVPFLVELLVAVDRELDPEAVGISSIMTVEAVTLPLLTVPTTSTMFFSNSVQASRTALSYDYINTYLVAL
jgi:hypothetical protein